MEKLRKLNIGCGNRKREGWVNLDIDPLCNPDIVRDVDKGLPFDDNSFDEVYCSHVLEHVQDAYFLMKEMHRICVNGSKIKIIVPHPNFPFLAWGDFSHRRSVSPLCFQQFDRAYDSYAVQNVKDMIGKAYYKIIEVIDDHEGKVNQQPQLYITLEVDKNE